MFISLSLVLFFALKKDKYLLLMCNRYLSIRLDFRIVNVHSFCIQPINFMLLEKLVMSLLFPVTYNGHLSIFENINR